MFNWIGCFINSGFFPTRLDKLQQVLPNSKSRWPGEMGLPSPIESRWVLERPTGPFLIFDVPAGAESSLPDGRPFDSQPGRLLVGYLTTRSVSCLDLNLVRLGD